MKAREIGINRTALYYRIKRGWNIEKALTEPSKKQKYKMCIEN